MINAVKEQTSQNELSKALVWSLGLHGILFVILAVRAVFLPSQSIELENAIRVDLVALPDKLKKTESEAAFSPSETTSLQKKESTKPPPPKVQLDNLKKVKPNQIKVTKQKQEIALKQLESMARLEKALLEARKQSSSTPPNETVATPQFKGNQLSKGTSPTGITRMDHQIYLRSIESKVRQNWNVPRWLANASLKTKVRLFIDSFGKVTKTEILLSSENNDFDSSVLRAIQASMPFSAPPDNLVNILSIDGAIIDFDPSHR